MEISPIPGIRALPAVKAPPAALGVSPLFDIENSGRTGDETYTPQPAKAAGGREDEFDDPTDDPEARPRSLDGAPRPRISIFA